jgi:hypothetical protein
LQIKIKQKLIPVKNRQIQKYKWDRQQKNQEEKINKYQENLQSCKEKKGKRMLMNIG